MSKYASALGSHSDFHISYRDFVDDLYLTYLFDPVGYAIIDVCFFIPYVHDELKNRRSLLRYMIEQGLVQAHFRHFREFDVTEFINRSEDHDLRAAGPFQAMLSSLRRMNVGGHLHSPDAIETAQILDRLASGRNFLSVWPRNPDGSIIETGLTLEKLVSRFTAADFVSTASLALDDHREAAVAEIKQVQEFIDKFMERQREYHPAGLGLRITSFLKAIAASYDIDNVEKINSSNDLITALQEGGHPDAVIELTKKALRVLSDRHSKNMSDLLRVGYSNPKSDYLTNILALSDKKRNLTSVRSISVSVSIPGLRRFQSMPIPDLENLMTECGFGEYRAAFKAWNTSPTEANVQEVVRALKRVEQLLRQKHPGENRQEFEASFWHGLIKTVRDKWIICQIEAQGRPIVTALRMAADLARSHPTAIKAVIDIAAGSPAGIAKTATDWLGKSKESSAMYDQFALFTPGEKVLPSDAVLQEFHTKQL